MQYSQLKNNIKIFLDIGERTDAEQWFFTDAKNVTMLELLQLLNKKKICVLHFNRLNRWRCAVLWWRLRHRQNIITRTIFFKNDGILSCVFDAKDSGAYPSFRRAHLSEPRGIKSKLIDHLPLAIRADDCFLLVSHSDVFDKTLMVDVSPELRQLNFMFFSNIDGKLLLVDGKSFHTGAGMVAKTTTNPQYVNVMVKEFETLQRIFEHTDKCGITPIPIKHIHGNRHDYYIEKYIGGRSLREILRDSQTCATPISVCSLIDHLDSWFNIYNKGFNGIPKSFHELYLPLFKSLRLVYCDNPELNQLVDKIWHELALLDKKHPGLTPVIAHNDLWPGNFVVTSDRFVAVDWERATSDRSELFDYFWMIISAVLEYRVGLTGIQDYSAGFRSFMTEDDLVCFHARKKIISRLVRNGISDGLLNLFYCLFLLEWSIQGWLVLKHQTNMDKLATEELLCFSRSLPDLADKYDIVAHS